MVRSPLVESPCRASAHGGARRILGEHAEPHDTSGEVIDDDAHPPAEWPPLRQSPRDPGHPESASRWDGREIDIPDLVGPRGTDCAMAHRLFSGPGSGAFHQHPGVMDHRKCMSGSVLSRGRTCRENSLDHYTRPRTKARHWGLDLQRSCYTRAQNGSAMDPCEGQMGNVG